MLGPFYFQQIQIGLPIPDGGSWQVQRFKKVIISWVLPTQGLVSSGGPTATLGTDVSQLLAQGCRTAFQLVLGKRIPCRSTAFWLVFVCRLPWIICQQVTSRPTRPIKNQSDRTFNAESCNTWSLSISIVIKTQLRSFCQLFFTIKI